jgi:hypothetical protein
LEFAPYGLRRLGIYLKLGAWNLVLSVVGPLAVSLIMQHIHTTQHDTSNLLSKNFTRLAFALLLNCIDLFCFHVYLASSGWKICLSASRLQSPIGRWR